MSGREVSEGWSRRRRVLLTQYERVALELCAARGFRAVTFDEVAAAIGVSTRTLFRYFPSKEDFLLELPRRGIEFAVATIKELAPSDDPVAALWSSRLESMKTEVPDTELLTLWRNAAADAPDVVSIVRGEWVQVLVDEMTEYCGRSLGVDPALDVRPGLMAGAVAGAEIALVEMITRSHLTTAEILARSADIARLLQPPPRRTGTRPQVARRVTSR
ncbi:MAG TPA: TetR family transcriptional regulator [Acidimicrobiales bacterium]|nr:TetR family transcriptional regulator [Acidimicrobiales bacterium]